MIFINLKHFRFLVRCVHKIVPYNIVCFSSNETFFQAIRYDEIEKLFYCHVVWKQSAPNYTLFYHHDYLICIYAQYWLHYNGADKNLLPQIYFS